jgi:hypothetical protein
MFPFVFPMISFGMICSIYPSRRLRGGM